MTITSQHFQIRYRGYERGAWSGGDASPPNKNNLVMEVNMVHGHITSQYFEFSYGGYEVVDGMKEGSRFDSCHAWWLNFRQCED